MLMKTKTKNLKEILMCKTTLALLSASVMAFGCEEIDHSGEEAQPEKPKTELCLGEVAEILSAIPLDVQNMEEVHDAVSSSSGNGYDDEYTMKDLFSSPGSGVGDDAVKSVPTAKAYEKPLKDKFAEYFATVKTRTGGEEPSPEEYIKALSASDMQIYWPYHENWDNKEMPIITFDPEDGSTKNIGYQISISEDGTKTVKEVIVDEETSMSRPVWVINRNDDSGYSSIEMLRRMDPEWGTGGGEIIVGKKGTSRAVKSNDNDKPRLKSLVLRDFTMHRNYDPWFAGASEFFVKCGSVEDFTATTENELLIYNPSITDFMIVVKRSEVGKPRKFNALLVSNWTEQLENCAFMITEDDGGTRKSWKCEANVKIKSKSYGFDILLPFNSRDDIVWRGQLSSRYLEEYSGRTCNFGDVSLTFEVIEK